MFGPTDLVEYDLEALKGLSPLVDGDTVAYRSGFAGEKTHYLITYNDSEAETQADLEYDNHKSAKERAEVVGGQIWSRKEVEPIENILQIAKTIVEGICEKFQTDNPTIILSGKTNFRDQIAVTKEYKGNRDANHRPKYLNQIREYLIKNWGAIRTNSYEADDGLGIEATRLGVDRSCIVTNDKDLDQIPGWHFNFVDNRVYKNTPKHASFCFYSQVLSGDVTDNVPGLPGIGPAKSRRLLEGATNTKDLFKRAWNAYLAFSGAETNEQCWKYLMEQANLVYILKKEDERYVPPMTFEEAIGISG